MKNIKVLGTGCASCKTTVEMINHLAEEKSVTIELEKVEDLQKIMAYGVMSTPAVVLDGKVVHTGGIPTHEKVEQWLATELSTRICPDRMGDENHHERDLNGYEA